MLTPWVKPVTAGKKMAKTTQKPGPPAGAGQLAEAARVDGARPMRFFWDILLPMSRTSIAALFVILFIYGWNQYLWPLLITGDEGYYTLLIGIKRMLDVGEGQAEWQIIMAATMLAMIPPVLIVIFMQKQFVRGMTETEK